ncbi:hypothetical protein CPCC7001_213 [Cyanobium sp. PCC 7001]|uniref:hypothetical protein n=1 Tax=Cyanobium sp. PCC 7001 TaxID=180281 RepID=UPI0001805BD2|nr:hypothetical protein [Cyanobium sp. PCC 7001]EDY37335.1 hypothetical protein CPCC7001_213 [Cyanobium sp. PCC 7001]
MADTPSTPQPDLNGFEIPADLLKARLRAWQVRPDAALKIYMDGDFACEFCDFWVLVSRVERLEIQVNIEEQKIPVIAIPSQP